MGHIYVITNKINNKKYIGYTFGTIKERFQKHCIESHRYDYQSAFYPALLKYGKENFTIESLYNFNEAEENWEELEQYYIKKYNTQVPNGYNIQPGGNKPPIHYGDENLKTKYPDEKLPELYNMLQNPKISYQKISEKTGLSIEYLYLINKGKYRYNNELKYPLRQYDVFELKALRIIEILNTDKTLSNKKIGDMFGIRPNEVASINHGKKYKYLWQGEFPIRKVLVPDNYDEKQELAKKVLKYKQDNPLLSYAQIQKDLNVKRGVFEKIIKGIYPYDVIID